MNEQNHDWQGLSAFLGCTVFRIDISAIPYIVRLFLSGILTQVIFKAWTFVYSGLNLTDKRSLQI